VDADSLFLRAKEAVDNSNYDYAIALFMDILTREPEHLRSLRALRGCELKKFQEAGAGAKVAALFKGIVPLIKSFLPLKPEKKIRACEKYLTYDPTSIGVLMRLGKAYARLGCKDAATDTLEFARQRKPHHIGALRLLAELSRDKGDYDKALRCMREVVKLRPTDRAAEQEMRRMSAEAHITESKIDKAKDFTEVLRDRDQAAHLEREQRVAHTRDEHQTEIAEARKEVEAQPKDAQAWRAYGDALSRAEQFQKAEEAYRKEFGLSKKFPARERVGEARRRRLLQVERVLKDKVEESGHAPDVVARYEQAHKQRLDFSIKETAFRCEHHPTDLKLAFRLGEYYFERGEKEDIQKAVREFQKAQGAAGLKQRARLMLARCFRQNPATLDMACDALGAALDEAEVHTDFWKRLTYELASVHEDMDETAEALALYKKIYAVDAGYRDVDDKVTTLS
jgi:tetratricopeptide (TPR) repeat protein